LIDRAILTTLHSDVDLLNNLAIDMLPTTNSRTYIAQDSVLDDSANGITNYPPEVLNSMNPTGLPPSRLLLKVGMPVILLRNLDSKKGLCNGTRLMVTNLKKRVILAKVLTGPFKNKRVLIPRVPIKTTDCRTTPVMFRRRQFPVKPALAMTINKSQGQSLQTVGIYLPQPVFTHGQLYVSLSRCTNENTLKVLILNGGIPNLEGTYTRNVVYRRVLT
jgi:ATP-dependent DNA helicase PIF1